MSYIVTSNLMGGLGNQMFQIAATYSYGRKWKLESKFNFNTCHTPLQGNPSTKYTNNLFKKISVLSETEKILGKVFTYNENNFSFEEIPFFDGNVILNGYFQNQKYFLGFDEDIKKLFTFSDESDYKVGQFLIGLPQNKINTSIHVRRGDYLKYPTIHPTCDLEYYKKGIEIITDSNFVVVSDDIKWCKENLKGDNIFFSPFIDEIDDLNLIKKCNNNIIANSTFSWWGAFLNDHINKRIVSPKVWFGEKGPKNFDEIIPKSWIKI